MSDSQKLHRHKSSCTIYLQPITVPPQQQNISPKPSTTVSTSSSTAPSSLTEIPLSSESETESFHSSVSETKPPNQSAVASVRTMTENFQKLLSQVNGHLNKNNISYFHQTSYLQATSEIKKLKRNNHSIEEEQTNLLNINEELSRETERLGNEERSWEIEREVHSRVAIF